MVDCKVLAICLVAGIVLAAGTKWLITRVIEPKTIKARERISKLKIREVVVGMISNFVGGIGAKLTVAAFAEAGVIGSSSPLKGSRPRHRSGSCAHSRHAYPVPDPCQIVRGTRGTAEIKSSVIPVLGASPP